MSSHSTLHLAVAGFVALAATAAGARPVARPPEQTPAVDEDADRALRRMSDYLASLQSFSVVAESTTDVISTDGQKITLSATSRVAVRRPDKLRSDRVSATKEITFIYDGKKVSVLDRRRNLYAQADAPANLDDAVDFARNELGLEAPGADLLMKDSYAILTDGVTSAKVIGNEEIDGVPVQHLAFRGADTDFQIWIERGARPLPRRFMITTKNVEGWPDFTVELHDWKTAFVAPPGYFTFTPPPGADRIDFVKAKPKEEERSAP